MQITEEDIFRYVLFPEELNSVKRKYISENENLFSDQIEFCKTFSTYSKEVEEQSKKAADRILGRIKIFELLPVTSFNMNKTLTLVAATAKTAVKKSDSATYSDEDSKYLIRLIRSGDQKLLYFFPKEETKEKKLKLTLLPTGENYSISDSIQQIVIKSDFSIDKILIEEE